MIRAGRRVAQQQLNRNLIHGYSKVIGIDLGTTNSCVAVVEGEGENAQPRIVYNSIGKRTTPSVVAFTKSGERLVGEKAKRQAVTNAKHTIYKAKRLIGRRYDDKAIQEERKVTPYDIVEGPGGAAYVKARDKVYSPAEIAANILTECKKTAEAHLGETVDRAVITVPAYFNDSQRKATKDAGEIAGLKVERIINEPTAAALAYGLEKKDGLVAVYDMGGGTFDISILDINTEDGVCQVISTNGDTYLGGEDFDNVLVQYILNKFKEAEGIDLSGDTLALQRIREAAETIKISLSHVKTDDINLPYICTTPEGEIKNLEMTITEDELDNMTKHMVQKSLDVCAQCIRDAKLKPNDIDNVVLVGGMTRMPLIQTMVKNFFGKVPSKGVNPDEVVATGAALQGAVLDGETTNTLMLFDVTPLSLGIELAGGVFSPIISKNTTIPYAQTKTYTTAEDNQTTVTVSVYQGERKIAKENRLLGEFTLTDIPPAPKAVPQIDVTFSIDANGIVSVAARDKASGSEQNIQVQSSSGLSDDDIERMKVDAEKYAEEDRQRMELVKLKNEIDTTITSIEDSLRVLGDGIGEEEQSQVRKDILALRSAVGTDIYDNIKKAYTAVQAHQRNYGEKAYRARAAGN